MALVDRKLEHTVTGEERKQVCKSFFKNVLTVNVDPLESFSSWVSGIEKCMLWFYDRVIDLN